MEKTFYDVQDIIEAEFNLSPLQCRFCKSLEVTYHQYIGDAYCADCGEWQSDITTNGEEGNQND